MWKTNRDVTAVYVTPDSKWCYAIISGESGWKLVKQTASDGVTNCCVALSAARANSRKVHVLLDGSNQITAVILL
jgi:hypothetical protein